MDTLLTPRPLSNTESSEYSDDDAPSGVDGEANYSYQQKRIISSSDITTQDSGVNYQSNNKVIVCPTARYLQVNPNKGSSSSFESLVPPAKRPRLSTPGAEPFQTWDSTTTKNASPIPSDGPSNTEYLFFENESQGGVDSSSDQSSFYNEHDKTGAAHFILQSRPFLSTISETSEVVNGFVERNYEVYQQLQRPSEVVSDVTCISDEKILREMEFYGGKCAIDDISHHSSTSGYNKEFPITEGYIYYINWPVGGYESGVMFRTENEKGRPAYCNKRQMKTPVYRLGDMSNKIFSNPVFLRDENDSSAELDLLEQCELSRNPPPEKRRKLNGPGEFTEEQEIALYKSYAAGEAVEKEEIGLTCKISNGSSEDLKRNEYAKASSLNFPSSNDALFSGFMQISIGSASLEESIIKTNEDSTAASSSFTNNQEEDILADIDNQFSEILGAAFRNNFRNNTIIEPPSMSGLMYHEIYTESLDDTIPSIISGQVIGSSQMSEIGDSSPYSIFLRNSSIIGNNGSGFMFGTLPFMHGMSPRGYGSSSESESRIEDVTEEDWEDKVTETLFQADNNPTSLRNKESEECELVDGLLDYDEENDVAGGPSEADDGEQEFLIQPTPQMKMSVSCLSAINLGDRDQAPKEELSVERRTKSDIFTTKFYRLTKSFMSLCQKTLKYSKVIISSSTSSDPSGTGSDNGEREIKCDGERSSEFQYTDETEEEEEEREMQTEQDEQYPPLKPFQPMPHNSSSSIKNTLLSCYRRLSSGNKISSGVEANDKHGKTPILVVENNGNNEIGEKDEMGNFQTCYESRSKLFLRECPDDVMCGFHNENNNVIPEFKETETGAVTEKKNTDRHSQREYIEIPKHVPEHHNDRSTKESHNLDLGRSEKKAVVKNDNENPLPAPVSKSKSTPQLPPQKEEKLARNDEETNTRPNIFRRILRLFFGKGKTSKSKKPSKTDTTTTKEEVVNTGQDENDCQNLTENVTKTEDILYDCEEDYQELIPVAKADRSIAKHTDSKELYRERRRRFFEEQKEFRDDSIKAYLKTILAARALPDYSLQSTMNNTPSCALSGCTDLLIPADLPEDISPGSFTTGRTQSDEILTINGRMAMSDSGLPTRKRRLGGQRNIVMQIPPVVPILAAAMAQQLAMSSIKPHAEKSGRDTNTNIVGDVKASLCPSEHVDGETVARNSQQGKPEEGESATKKEEIVKCVSVKKGILKHRK